MKLWVVPWYLPGCGDYGCKGSTGSSLVRAKTKSMAKVMTEQEKGDDSYIYIENIYEFKMPSMDTRVEEVIF